MKSMVSLRKVKLIFILLLYVLEVAVVSCCTGLYNLVLSSCSVFRSEVHRHCP